MNEPPTPSIRLVRNLAYNNYSILDGISVLQDGNTRHKNRYELNDEESPVDVGHMQID